MHHKRTMNDSTCTYLYLKLGVILQSLLSRRCQFIHTPKCVKSRLVAPHSSCELSWLRKMSLSLSEHLVVVVFAAGASFKVHHF